MDLSPGPSRRYAATDPSSGVQRREEASLEEVRGEAASHGEVLGEVTAL